MSTEKIFYILLAIVVYICGEYLWISKILFLELESIIKHIKDPIILSKAEYLKINSNFSPKYLFKLFKFINHVEKTLNIDSLNIEEE